MHSTLTNAIETGAIGLFSVRRKAVRHEQPKFLPVTHPLQLLRDASSSREMRRSGEMIHRSSSLYGKAVLCRRES